MARNRNWHISATATNIDSKGFTIHLDSGSDTILFSAAAAWISYPADKLGVMGGTLYTKNIQANGLKGDNDHGWVKFPVGMFLSEPRVMIAFNSLHVDCKSSLMLFTGILLVNKDSMNWFIEWAGTNTYSAGVSFIAIA